MSKLTLGRWVEPKPETHHNQSPKPMVSADKANIVNPKCFRPPANHVKEDATMTRIECRLLAGVLHVNPNQRCHCRQNLALRHQRPRRNPLMGVIGQMNVQESVSLS